jgi:predicted amidohydrolase
VIRIVLAQLHYCPAYFAQGMDFLSEPAPSPPNGTPLGALRSLPEVDKLLKGNRASYLSHVSALFLDLVQWVGANEADLLVLPEYAVPLECLEALRDLAHKHALAIVAGSHRVPAGQSAREIYERLGISATSAQPGSAVSPLILPSRAVHLFAKSTRSKWEPELKVADPSPQVVEIKLKQGELRLSVLPCIDALNPAVLGALFSADAPQLVVCPSYSPSTAPFEHIAGIVSGQESLIAYANSAAFGGTTFGLPNGWMPSLEGLRTRTTSLPAGTEGLLLCDVDPMRLFSTRGSAVPKTSARHPRGIPFLRHNGPLASAATVLGADLATALKHPADLELAQDLATTFLINNSDDRDMAPVMLANLRDLSHHLPFFNGQADDLLSTLDFVPTRMATATVGFQNLGTLL